MGEDLLNILSDNNKDINNRKLMDYISGRLSGPQRNEVERWMMENPLVADAVEGLQHAGEDKKIQLTVDQLNQELRKYLDSKKKRRQKKIFPLSGWTYMAVFLIIALAIIVYFVIRMLSNNN